MPVIRDSPVSSVVSGKSPALLAFTKGGSLAYKTVALNMEPVRFLYIYIYISCLSPHRL